MNGPGQAILSQFNLSCILMLGLNERTSWKILYKISIPGHPEWLPRCISMTLRNTCFGDCSFPQKPSIIQFCWNHCFLSGMGLWELLYKMFAPSPCFIWISPSNLTSKMLALQKCPLNWSKLPHQRSLLPRVLRPQLISNSTQSKSNCFLAYQEWARIPVTIGHNTVMNRGPCSYDL